MQEPHMIEECKEDGCKCKGSDICDECKSCLCEYYVNGVVHSERCSERWL
jgi:hypothetical protein